MTTIATDGKTISADTLQIGRYIDQIESVKLYRIGGIVYGCCGVTAESLKYLKWVGLGGPKGKNPDLKDEFSIIWVKDGKVWFDNYLFQQVECGIPQAIGSGAVYAMGAMLAGASPKEALKIAMKLDVDTGGKIKTMKC